MIFVNISAVIIAFPSSNTVHRLSAFVSCALLVIVGICTGMSIVCYRNTDLVEPAADIAMIISIVTACVIGIPSSYTVHRLVATLCNALLILIHICTSVAIMCRYTAYSILAALLVLMGILIICTRGIGTPRSNTVHRLRTTLSGALNIAVGISTSITIVSGIGANSIGSAASVLVVFGVMLALAIVTKRTHTVHRLAARLALTGHLAIGIGTLLAIQVSLGGHLVDAAALILVIGSHMTAAAVSAPLTLTIHRLATARLGALLQFVCMRTSIAIVQGRLAHRI